MPMRTIGIWHLAFGIWRYYTFGAYTLKSIIQLLKAVFFFFRICLGGNDLESNWPPVPFVDVPLVYSWSSAK